MDIQKAVDSLNDAFERDPMAMDSMFNVLVQCNEDLAKHPTFQVQHKGWGEDETFVFTAIGLINAIVEPLTDGRIATMIDDETGDLLGFCVYQKTSN